MSAAGWGFWQLGRNGSRRMGFGSWVGMGVGRQGEEEWEVLQWKLTTVGRMGVGVCFSVILL